MLVLVVMFLYF